MQNADDDGVRKFRCIRPSRVRSRLLTDDNFAVLGVDALSRLW
jgi:hypothetical protein